jgi:ABC-type transport system involved in multi-copper enzyme maturation permease subunit
MPNPVLTIARYTVLEALRNRLPVLVLAVLFAGVGLGMFLKQVAITETAQIQGAMLASLYRLAAVFTLASFVIVSQVREANDKGLELVLSLSVPRNRYFFAKLLGFLICALALSAVFGIPLAIYSPPAQVIAWTVSLFLELAIVATASLFCVLTLSQVTLSLAVVSGFYALSRSMAALQLIGGARTLDQEGLGTRLLRGALEAVATVLPRLDQFTQTNWLVNSADGLDALPGIAAQSLIYVALLSTAALFDLQRKNL